MQKVLFVVFLFVIGLANTNCYSQGRLGDVKGDIKKEKPKRSSNSGSNGSKSRGSTNNSSDNSGFAYLVAESLVKLTGYAIYYVGYKLPIGEVESRKFFDYPYANGSHGEYSHSFVDLKDKKSNLTFSNTLSMHDKNLFANKASLNYRFIRALGVEASYLQFYETDPLEDLNMTSGMLNFYRIREENVTGFWGIGLTHVGSDVQRLGFAYNMGLDVYWGSPISTELYWKQSFINKTALNEFKLMVNYHINKSAISLGLVNHNLAGHNFAMLGAGFKTVLH